MWNGWIPSMAYTSTSAEPAASAARSVEELLDRMTLEEKVAQLGSVNAGKLLDEDGAIDRGRVEALLSDGIGHFTRLGGEGSLPPERAAEVTNELQRYLREETRLGIPAVPHEECLSGYMGPQGTTFPQMLGVANTWSPELVTEITDVIRGELEAIGCTHALSPVLDVGRDLRWGRVEETFGEDPYLIAELANAYVTGLQGDSTGDADAAPGIDATLKHFVGHAVGEGGKNRSSVQIGERELREVHLFPFEAVVREGDAAAVMNAYHDIDGVPCARDERLLTDILRGEWGFDGTVVSDYYSVEFLKSEHGVAASDREAGVAALEAGIDVELPYTDCYGDHLVEAVEAGELSEATVDTAVRRVLEAKASAGLLEEPTVDAAAAPEAFGTAAGTDLARRAARESITLLENDGLLPLAGDDLETVALVGPKADNDKELLGDYAYAAHYDEVDDFDATTPRDALEARGAAAGFDVEYTPGCTTTGPATDGFDAAATAAAAADVAIVCVGARSAVDFSDTDEEGRNRPSVPTSGEGCDVTDLGLPGVQADLVERLLETGTPVVVTVVSGKPHAIESIAESAPAVLHAWLPGEEGGAAVADVLFGEHNPSGRLPLSIPKSVGQLPVYYSRKPNSATEDHVYVDSEPLYPFGYGLSYTDFEYGDLAVSTDAIGPSGSVTATVEVTNAGTRAGHEVVQLYQRAENPTQARPVQELVGFERVHLEPGQTATVSFRVDASQLAYHDRDMNLTVEAGPYELRVGASAADIADTAAVEVTATKTVPQSARTYFTETSTDLGD
jgi:beta-glucosidase